MNVSTRLTLALHVLALLASKPGEPLTSEYIAGSVQTNPAFLRRLMGALRKKGWVASRPGQRGGWELAVDPDRLTLADVRRAMNEGSPFAMHAQPPNPACPVGRNIQGALGIVYDRAERALEDDLSQTSISGLLGLVQRGRRG